MAEAIASDHHVGDGPFTARCQKLLEQRLGVARALLTTSCTTALELAAILARGDAPPSEPLEVIMPAFTFVSTPNAFLLHGFTPVFADIRPDTCNLDERQVSSLLTRRTRAIVAVHYAGVPCAMDPLREIASAHSLVLIEDAAQALFATYRGRPAGALGTMGCFSFHGTKNISCGEGGAITFSAQALVDRGEILREKGTNRKAFFRGQVDKYTWVDVGGSYLPSDLLAAYLWGQLEAEAVIHARRGSRYAQYREGLQDLSTAGHLTLPHIPDDIESNHHLFHIVVSSETTRDRLIAQLKEEGIGATFHYGALHLSPVGRKLTQSPAPLPVTERIARCLVRLPLYPDLTEQEASRVIDAIRRFFLG